MITKTKRNLVVGVVAFAVLAATHLGTWLHGNNHGKVTQRNQYYEELETLRGQLSDQKQESAKVVAQRDAILKAERRETSAKINRLLRENQKFRDWWNQSVPDDAADIAYGVRSGDSQDGVRRGPLEPP